MRWMHLRLEAPLASFGGEAIDARGIIRDFPAQSMLTGLFANALGWTRAMKTRHQGLQDRIVFGAAHDEDPVPRRFTDYQTAQLGKRDKAWTTSGVPAGRSGGANTYVGMHQRWRDYHADLRMSVVVRLDPQGAAPTLDDLAIALRRPARPLFIGRKPCLPACGIFRAWLDAPDVRTALSTVIAPERECYAQWPYQGRKSGAVVRHITDERNWVSGLHGGARRVCMGHIGGRGDA